MSFYPIEHLALCFSDMFEERRKLVGTLLSEDPDFHLTYSGCLYRLSDPLDLELGDIKFDDDDKVTPWMVKKRNKDTNDFVVIGKFQNFESALRYLWQTRMD